jgi:hypothetical protein
VCAVEQTFSAEDSVSAEEQQKAALAAWLASGIPKSQTKEYRTWGHIRNRCNNKNSAAYRLYGARGIKVCERWKKFENFLADMGPSPSPSHSIDRIDNDGNYEPGNCRWATTQEQAANKRNNVRFTFHGVTRIKEEWAKHFGICAKKVDVRLRLGWEPLEAFSTPINARRRKAGISGINGIYESSYGKWCARVCVFTRIVYLGSYSTKAEAIAAVRAAELIAAALNKHAGAA